MGGWSGGRFALPQSYFRFVFSDMRVHLSPYSEKLLVSMLQIMKLYIPLSKQSKATKTCSLQAKTIHLMDLYFAHRFHSLVALKHKFLELCKNLFLLR